MWLRVALCIGSVAVACSSAPDTSCQVASGTTPCIFDRMHIDPKSTVEWGPLGSPIVWSVGYRQPCTVTWSPLALEDVPSEGKIAVDHVLTIRCYDPCIEESCAGGGFSFQFELSDLGDPRTWPVSRTLPGPCLAHSGISASDDNQSSCFSNSICGVVVNTTVETAQGSAAMPPNPVTADYSRTFRIDIDATKGVPLPNGTSCNSATASFSAHLWLMQTAADWEPTACPNSCR